MTSISSQLPKRNWPLTRWLGSRVLRLLGWRIDGALPDLSKAVIAVAPHTSNWDFIIGMSAALSLDLDANWLGKKALFRGICGSLLRMLGGIPVDRAHPAGLLQQVVEASEKQKGFLLGISPEGTRKPVTPWKTGCCRIACAARIPLVPVALDYPRKTIRVFSPWIPDDNLEANMARLSRHYHPRMAKKPQNFLPHSAPPGQQPLQS